ncbi:MAG: hypothetical protein WCQ49_01530 [Candidatus Saccharibacteria bacterium]
MKNIELKQLSNDNEQIIKCLTNSTFVERSKLDELTTDECIEANMALAAMMYGTEVSNLIKNGNYTRLDSIHKEISEPNPDYDQLINQIDMNKLGIIIIRPELMEAQEECIKLIENNNLDIILNKDIKINFHQYWNLYPHGLIDPGSYQDFPTRTLNYINKDITLLLVTKNVEYISKPISDIITDELKGRQGSHTPGTLRGDIAYNGLKRFVKDKGENLIKDANIALDPIGAYRKLASNKIPSDRAHNTADCPILFYAAQGVHIPDSKEITRDIKIFLEQKELESLINTGKIPIKIVK